MKCPKCGSENLQFATSTRSGNSTLDSCCGYMLFGPLGLLCGSNSTETKEFWVCNQCGAKFSTAKIKSSEDQRKQQANAEESRRRTIESVPEEVRANIDEECLRANEFYQGAEQAYLLKRKEFFAENPSEKTLFLVKLIPKVMILCVILPLSIALIDTLVAPLIGLVVCCVIANSEPNYAKRLPPEVADARQKMIAAKNRKEVLDKVKAAMDAKEK